VSTLCKWRETFGGLLDAGDEDGAVVLRRRRCSR